LLSQQQFNRKERLSVEPTTDSFSPFLTYVKKDNAIHGLYKLTTIFPAYH